MATRRLLIRPGAIGDCILSLPALEFLKTDYTEVWISSPMVPLIQFADRVRSIQSSGLDRVLDELPPNLAGMLDSFDAIVSWYGTNRPDFRSAMPRHCAFLNALPPHDSQDHATDFFLRQVGAPLGSVPVIRVEPASPRNSVIIHPFSGGKNKNLPLQIYQLIARQMPVHVEWIAGPEEILPCAERFDNLRDLASWMTGGVLYLGNDSGISHLAAAIGLPTVAVFRTTDPRIWAPRGHNVLPYSISS